MRLFLLWGPPFATGDGPKKMAKHCRLATFQSDTKGSKRDQNGQPKCFNHLGPFWAHLDPFRRFQTNIDLFSEAPYFDHLEQKIHFCLKWSKRALIGPKGSQMVKNTWVDHGVKLSWVSKCPNCQIVLLAFLVSNCPPHPVNMRTIFCCALLMFLGRKRKMILKSPRCLILT